MESIVEFVTSGPAHALSAILLLSLVLWTSCRTGRVALQVLGYPDGTFTRLEERLFSLGLGMLILSALVFLLGVSGALTRPAVTLVLVILLAITQVRLNRCGTEEWGCRDVLGYLKNNPLFSILTVSVFFLALIQALAPPIGNDALAYHLYHAKEFVLRHRIQYLPYSRESLWPYFTETFFMIGLLLEGTIFPQLFHWAFYILTAALVYSFGRRFYDEKLARAAFLIFIFTPVAFAQAGHAYVDLSLAFFVFAALYAFLLYDVYRDDKIFVLAGAFAGGAAAVKYLGLGACLILGILIAAKTRFRLKALACFALAAFLAAGFWYVHSWAAIGNPVYPFFPKFFGGNGFEFDIGAGVGMGKNLIAFLKLGWNMTMHPLSFGGEMIGPLFLMFTPLAFLGIKKARPAALFFTVFTVFYTYFLFTQSQHLRFYLSVAPMLSIAAAAGLRNVSSFGVWHRRAALAALAAVLCLHGMIFVYRTRYLWPVVAGKISAEKYLLKYERSYEGYRFFRDHLKGGERYFVANEVRYFYNQAGERMAYDSLPLRADLKKKNISLEQFLEGSKFEYLWIEADAGGDIALFLKNHAYRKVFSYDFKEKPRTFHNEIYQLDASDHY